jgi:hypothetical protein
MRALTPIALLACVLAASAASATPAPNVKGTVVRAAGSSGCFPGEPCDPLPPPMYVVFSRGSVATRARLGANGSFSLRLKPGLYSVTVAPPRGLLTPSSVRVPRVGVVRPRLVERRR